MSNVNKIGNFIHYNSFIGSAEKLKVGLDIYIDSSDIIYMLLGIKNMISADRDIEMDLYHEESTLIYSLIYGGWLNKVNLTIPYQEELYNQLDKGYIFKGFAKKENVREFWGHVLNITGLKQADFEIPLSNEEYVEKLRPKADELYKANYLIRELRWPKRLKYLLNEEILVFEKPSDDLISLVKSDMYNELYQVYSHLRPDKPEKNNITDALVLTLLHRRLELYNQEKSLSVPILYDREGVFRRVLKRANMSEKFMCNIGGTKFSTICSGDFFTYLALNRNKEKISDLVKKGKLSDYKEMYGSVFDDGSGSQFADEYKQRISNFVESKFLQVCWVNSKEEVHEFIADLIKFKDSNLRSPESNETLSQEIDDILSQLKESVDKYSIFSETYAKISRAQLAIQRGFTSNLKKYQSRSFPFNVTNDLSLTRFSMPKETWEPVQTISNELLFSEKHDAKPPLITDVVEYVIDGIQGTNRDKLLISLTVFWILGEYDLIIRIVDRLEGNYSHYSEALLHAASIAKQVHTNDDRIKILDILKRVNDINIKASFTHNYKTAIAASYIYFQTWWKMYDRNFLSSLEEPEQSENPDIQYLFRKAMDWAKCALKWLSDDNNYLHPVKTYRKEKYYYILNNFIYYVTMGDSDNEFINLNKKVTQLESLEQSTPRLWQYRYHDTLALFYFRKAIMAKQVSNENDFNLFQTEALRRIRLAMEGVLSIEDQESYVYLERKIKMTSFSS